MSFPDGKSDLAPPITLVVFGEEALLRVPYLAELQIDLDDAAVERHDGRKQTVAPYNKLLIHVGYGHVSIRNSLPNVLAHVLACIWTLSSVCRPYHPIYTDAPLSGWTITSYTRYMYHAYGLVHVCWE